ncbi:hypothetical protein ACH5RR_001352 [Cinchona calisaya]|uniref:SWIM-type domain-containing protein n=1 Tax=Cinchona calisaya TaxID=153742 RepID=A0ABD3B3L0_9GENT
MFEWIRRRLMAKIQIKKIGMEKFQGNSCSNVQEKIEKNKKLSRGCVAIWAGQKQFEVDTPKGQVVVNLDDCTRTYALFQLNSIHCPHAVVAIQVDRKTKVEDYVDECYTKYAYQRSYAHMIHAMPVAQQAYHVASTSSQHAPARSSYSRPIIASVAKLIPIPGSQSSAPKRARVQKTT